MGAEGFSESIEAREAVIDAMIKDLAMKEGVAEDFVVADIMMFAPIEGNEAVNLEYLAEVAEKIGITVDEMQAYAILKANKE